MMTFTYCTFQPNAHVDLGQAAFHHRDLFTFEFGRRLDVWCEDDLVRADRRIGVGDKLHRDFLFRGDRAVFHRAAGDVQLAGRHRTEALVRVFDNLDVQINLRHQVLLLGNEPEAVARPGKQRHADFLRRRHRAGQQAGRQQGSRRSQGAT